MHAVRWQTELRVSRHALWVANGWICACLVLILLTPWHGGFFLLKPLAVLALAVERRYLLRRIQSRSGIVSFDEQEAWTWQQQQWRLTAPLCWMPWGVMLSWRCGPHHHRWWLMADSMSEQAWRELRFYWLKGRNRRWQ
ncbi:protein YgfX [Rosenbergiella collisarenosi]|uniref:protein YgfX n=1 Tax=Rosenbergiella collisarenosi TaxID=1544695 RepID=UPI001F4F7405